MDNQNYQDFGISTGKRRACTYYASQETCGGKQNNECPKSHTAAAMEPPDCTRPGVIVGVSQDVPNLKGRSYNTQRAETLMTVTGWIRGSFVSTLHFYNKYFSLIWPRERVATT